MPNSVPFDLLPPPALSPVEKILAANPRVLVCTMGFPRSGKSTWAAKQPWPIVSFDAIRLALHGQRFVEQAEPFVEATGRIMVRSLFHAGHKVVVFDGTNISKQRRMMWFEDDWTTYWKVFDVSSGTCRERAIADDRQDLLPVIERMYMQRQPLSPSCNLWPE